MTAKTYGSALFSNSGEARFVLERQLIQESFSDEGTLVAVLGNPSKADGDRNDATLRRLIGYGERWGHRRLIVVNVCPWISTSPAALRTLKLTERIWEANLHHVGAALAKASRVLVGWGDVLPAAMSGRRDDVVSAIRAYGLTPVCLGTTKAGQPVHPLRQRADLQPIPWPVAA